MPMGISHMRKSHMDSGGDVRWKSGMYYNEGSRMRSDNRRMSRSYMRPNIGTIHYLGMSNSVISSGRSLVYA